MAEDPYLSHEIPVFDVEKKRDEIDEPWSPIELARVNDQVIRMALFLGKYHWHRHANEDELFYVYRETLTIRMREHPIVTLQAGQMAVIP